MAPGRAVPIAARGGIPSREHAVGDPETAAVQAWSDAPGDERWSHPDAADVLRAMDRFHPIPDVLARAGSWAEWLYFNARTPDGRVRLYLTFLVGPRAETSGKRVAGVRLQVDRDGRTGSYSASSEVDDAAVVANAPDLEIGGSRVRLDGLTYHVTLALEGLTGDLVLEAAPGRSMPPTAIRGAGGWVSGYVVPALAGTVHGSLTIGKEQITIVDAAGYHDHNWGFWEGVSWQWGQVAHDDLSVVYGRVFPPADVADASRVPGFMGVLGANGPLGFSTNVTIDDSIPGHVDVRASGRELDLRMTFAAAETVRSAMGLTRGPSAVPLDFLQLGGSYKVTGSIAGRPVDFTARGSAETFKPRTKD